MIVIFIVVALIIVLILKDIEINNLKNELDIKATENKSLRRVLYENNLIPGNFVK